MNEHNLQQPIEIGGVVHTLPKWLEHTNEADVLSNHYLPWKQADPQPKPKTVFQGPTR